MTVRELRRLYSKAVAVARIVYFYIVKDALNVQQFRRASGAGSAIDLGRTWVEVSHYYRAEGMVSSFSPTSSVFWRVLMSYLALLE